MTNSAGTGLVNYSEVKLGKCKNKRRKKKYSNKTENSEIFKMNLTNGLYNGSPLK